MPSNLGLNAGSGGSDLVTKQVTHDGDTAHLQGVSLLGVTGTEDSYTIANINGSAANGLEVDVTQVQGTVTVDGSGVTQPVSGTVTANLSATDNAVLDTIDTALDAINAKLVTGTVIGDVNLGATDNAVLDSIDSAVNGTLTVGSHAVTNAGTFAVQIADTSFAVADGNALGEGVLIQGDDGTDRKNINVDATTGDVQVDVTNTVTVDGSGVTQPVSGTVTANLSATDNAVLDTIDAVLDTINAKLVTGTVIGDVNLGATDNAVLDAIQAAVEGTITVDLGANNDVTVTGTVDLGATDNAVLDTIATPVATISATPLQRVAIFDAADSQITSFGGGTQYTEDGVADANPTGTAPILVREDAPALVAADGDYVAQRSNAYGAAYAQIVDSNGNFIDTFGGSGGTATADDGAFTAGSGQGTPAMGFFSTDTVDSGDVGVLAMDASRRLLCSIEVDNVGIGGGTQYTEDAVAAADPVGNAQILVREDGPVSVAADGDNVARRGTAYGAAFTQLIDSSGNFLNGTDFTNLATLDGNAIALGSSIANNGTLRVTVATDDVVTVDLGANNDVTVTGTVDLGATDNAVLDAIAASVAGTLTVDLGANNDVNVTQMNGVNVTMGNGASGTGVQRVTLASDSTGQVAVASVVPGTGATNLGKAIDSVAGATDSGVAALARRRDAATTITPANLDYTHLNVNSLGKLWVTGTHLEDAAHATGDVGMQSLAVSAATATATAGTAGDYQPLSVSSVNGRLYTDVAGDIAHDGVDSGSPLKIGGKAYSFDGTAPQTAVAEGDRVNAIFTPQGAQYVEITHPNYWRAHNQAGAAQTNITIKAAPGAGLKLYITDVIVSNGATAGNIKLLDGSGGTVLLEVYPAINGGATHSFRTPLALTANTLLAITSTTVTTHSVTVTGFIAA